MKAALPLLALLSIFARAEIPKPDRVLKLWDGKPPGEFTVPGPETEGARPPRKMTNDEFRMIAAHIHFEIGAMNFVIRHSSFVIP